MFTFEIFMAKCEWHLCENEAVRKFCGTKCKTKFHVSVRRRRLKELAVEYKGGKCELCGYNRCIKALEFHHTDPSEKDFAISQDGHTKSWEKIRTELDKCIIVCANCHREIHDTLGHELH